MVTYLLYIYFTYFYLFFFIRKIPPFYLLYFSDHLYTFPYTIISHTHFIIF